MTYSIDLSGKTAAIIGGSRGIGRAIAEKLSHAGATVFVGSRGDGSEETVSIIEEKGGKAGFANVDVTKEEEVSEFLDKAIEFGGDKLDIVIVNAGVIETEAFLKASGDQFRDVLDVNAVGAFIGAKQGILKMKDTKAGKIVMTASFAGQGGMADFSQYGASKAATISIMQSAAHVGAEYGINVNAIAPGIIRTDMWEEILTSMTDNEDNKDKDRDELFDENIENFIPLARPQTEEDIANAVLFLSCELADEITGQTINIDGGAIMH